MEASEKIIRSLLRIITPGEISELTKIASLRPREALTEIMLREYERGREKLEKDSSSEPTLDEDLEEASSGRTVDKDVKLVLKGGEELSRGSLFILFQKEKLRSSVAKIKEKEVFDSYKKNSSVDLNQEKQNRKRDDRNLSSHVGILINKKQF
ncbi:MAG: hypothetical protein CME68_02415 [Halobacteriovoraceae bacterium]|nr:hypothetical protein [Halobacteriovoraceae bacterium]|tara:strand:+ start:304 stop:762 length:459 start_codon:yes stop_codon:yes gene_type:complete